MATLRVHGMSHIIISYNIIFCTVANRNATRSNSSFPGPCDRQKRRSSKIEGGKFPDEYLLESAKWKTAAETADGGRRGLLRATQRVPLLLLKKFIVTSSTAYFHLTRDDNNVTIIILCRYQ